MWVSNNIQVATSWKQKVDIGHNYFGGGDVVDSGVDYPGPMTCHVVLRVSIHCTR